MEKKKTATKTSSRARLNVSPKVKDVIKVAGAIGVAGAIKKSTKKKSSKSKNTQVAESVATKSANKSPIIFAVIISLIIGILIGAFVIYGIISKNDCFDILGGDELTYTLEEEYVEKGVKIIEFGKDISDQVKIETNLVLDNGKATEEGTFYIKYTVDSIKYGKIFKIEKIRLVTFVEPSEGGE